MVTLNPIFTNDMILQANKPVRVFGNGTGDVTVEFLGKTQSVVSNGEWYAEFDAHGYGGPYEMSVTLDGVKTEITGIYFGDVYLLGGQSNMQFKCGKDVSPLTFTRETKMYACLLLTEWKKTPRKDGVLRTAGLL